MDSLIAGVKIFRASGEGEGILLSAGTSIAGEIPHQRYASAALVPQEPWRAPTASEATLLLDTTFDRFLRSQDVAVVQLPPALRARVLSLDVDGLAFLPPTGSIQLHPSQQEVISDLCHYLLDTYLLSHDHLVVGPVVAGLPDLVTTTFVRPTQRFAGLHLDSWDQAVLGKRGSSSNRLCVNLGKAARRFLFLNLPLKHLATILYPDATQELDAMTMPDIDRLGLRFMTRFPHYPIVAATLQPGEAYIAPTENLFHDGSTFGSTANDCTITLRGYFGLRV